MLFKWEKKEKHIRKNRNKNKKKIIKQKKYYYLNIYQKDTQYLVDEFQKTNKHYTLIMVYDIIHKNKTKLDK